MTAPYFDHSSLSQWFLDEKRELPWRDSPSPYAVWISEVMLQQTQASVVKPYFERWMERFPTVEHLAEAPLNVVIKLWEGLGYYSRARNLHEGAKAIVKEFHGRLPNTYEGLATLKGLGPYTIGAILNFAFHQKAAAVDGNVLRVVTRYFALDLDISKEKNVREIRKLVENFLPEEQPWVVSEALIELGALVCTKQPKCSECPLQKTCKAHLQGKTAALPIKTKGPTTIALQRIAAVISFENLFLVKKGEAGKLMQDLHEFPYFELQPQGMTDKELHLLIAHNLGLTVHSFSKLPQIKHSFTKYRVELHPMRCVALEKHEVAGYSWQTLDALSALPFSSGHRKVFDLIHKA